jgi:hypothetical protein
MHHLLRRLPVVVVVAAVLLTSTSPAYAVMVTDGDAAHSQATTDAHEDEAATAGVSPPEMPDMTHDDRGTVPDHEVTEAGTDTANPPHQDAGEGHGDDVAARTPRPRVAVLSIFAALNAGVLAVAALLRRRDRDKPRHRPRPLAATAPTPA